MMKHRILFCALFLLALLCACGAPEAALSPASGEAPAKSSAPPSSASAQTEESGADATFCSEAAIAPAQAEERGADATFYSETAMAARAEALGALAFSASEPERTLEEAGVTVLHAYDAYPSSYLSAPEALLSFWQSVQRGTDCALELVSLRKEGCLSYQILSLEAQTPYFTAIRCERQPDGTCSASVYERCTVKSWLLSENGNFYYRLFPAGDKHYADYNLIRTNAPDEALFSMLEQYVLPIDYYYVNLLITDWQEGSWGEVSFSDVFDRLYALTYGREISPEDFSRSDETGLYQIPAEAFETVILSCFSLSQSELRALAGFDAQTQSYPWRPIETNDMERYDYPAIEPYLTAAQENADGTLSLFISCLSTDIPTDCIFSHVLTVRPLENGGFQYVSNEMTFQTEYGLPNPAPRLQKE